MGKKARKELEAELRALRNHRRVEGASSIINNLICWGGLVVIVRYGYLSVQALAGQLTIADIGVDFGVNIQLSDVFSWLFGGSGIFYGYRQRQLRRKTIERLQGRIRELESSYDPRRTSSGLTPRGETNPKDL